MLVLQFATGCRRLGMVYVLYIWKSIGAFNGEHNGSLFKENLWYAEHFVAQLRHSEKIDANHLTGLHGQLTRPFGVSTASPLTVRN